jgi:hypothetical protein
MCGRFGIACAHSSDTGSGAGSGTSGLLGWFEHLVDNRRDPDYYTINFSFSPIPPSRSLSG